MKRLIDYYLINWKNDPDRKPLLLRGARQVGKTYAARAFGNKFDHFVEVNLEFAQDIHTFFEKDLDPVRIMRDLSLYTGKRIIPGVTLLFLDEIQACEKALQALRYFYELMPELHIIAAGSLLDFAIEKQGIPVGRIDSLYMYPLSFMEFLAALDKKLLLEEILDHKPEREMNAVIHKDLLVLLGEYLALGGMPKVIECWHETRDATRCSKIHSSILNTYRDDFGKYARKFQIKYVELLFDSVPQQLGNKFKYSYVEGDYRKRELAPALDLLTTAGVASKVYYSAGQGVPLGAQIDPQDYKVIFLDVGLSQAVLGIDLKGWLLYPLHEYANKGSLVEAFIGQELLVYANPIRRRDLYYWHSKKTSINAEIDYLAQMGNEIIPVEVKSGDGRALKSIRRFLETHSSPFGVRFSTHNYSVHEHIYSYPLYAVGSVVGPQNREVNQALKELGTN